MPFDSFPTFKETDDYIVKKVVALGPSVKTFAFASCLAVAAAFAACDKKEEPAPEPAATHTAAVVEEKPVATAEPEPTQAEPSEVEGDEKEELAAADKPSEGADKAADPKTEKKPDPKTDAPSKAEPAPKEEATGGYKGPNPCVKTTFAFGAVKSACAKGGAAAAKDLMKGYVKRGKDQGKNWKCSTCHTDTKTYPNKPNAVADLKSIF